MSRIL